MMSLVKSLVVRSNLMKLQNPAYSKLFFTNVALLGPIVAFFGTKTLLLGPIFQWDSSEVRTDVVSAVVAVIVLHIALGFYIVKAYFSETDPKHQLGKRD